MPDRDMSSRGLLRTSAAPVLVQHVDLEMRIPCQNYCLLLVATLAVLPVAGAYPINNPVTLRESHHRAVEHGPVADQRTVVAVEHGF